MGLVSRRRPDLLDRWLRPALLAMLATAVIVSAASACMFLTTASEFVNLVFEPVSILLLPGLLVAMFANNMHGKLTSHGPHPTETHDFSNDAVLYYSLAFYFLVFLLFFHRRALRRNDELTPPAPSR